jgi:transposase
MSNELSDTERKSILGLLRMGWSVRRIARETGHSREAISRYRTKVGLPTSNLAGSPQVAADLSVPESSKPAGEPEVPTDSGTHEQATRTAGRSICEPYRAFIADERGKGRNATAIYQDLVEHHGYDGSYDAVKRFVRTIEPPDEPYAKCRFETEPGQEAQVDYGEGAPTLDPRTGKYRKPRLFIMTLGYSRHAYRVVVPKSSQEIWCKLHEDAFAYFGGTALTMRLDNLREGVIAPDIYDPELNALYAAMLAFYNVVALPCRPYAPDAKGKVESAVGYTQETALKGRRFKSIDEQNAFLTHWNEKWAATRIHGTTKRQVRAMFEQERPALQELPTTRFEYYSILERRVHLDAHIEVAGAYYSAPPRYVGRKVIVHAGNPWLRIIDEKTKQCIREHAATHKGSRRTNDEDRPKQTPRAVLDLVESIADSGSACAAFAQTLVEQNGALAARSLYGLLSYIRQHGAAEVERVCGIAVRMGAFRLRFVRMLLSRSAAPQPLTDKHPLIEALATYRSHFTTITQGELFK